MPVLNEGFIFRRHAPLDVRNAFHRHSAKRPLFLPSHAFYKFSELDLFRGDDLGKRCVGQPISPWWCSVSPLTGTADDVLDGLISQARRWGIPVAELARVKLAIKREFNRPYCPGLPLARVLRIRLIKPVYGFYGRATSQQDDSIPLAHPPPRPRLLGGGYQVWIPNLTAEHFQSMRILLLQ